MARGHVRGFTSGLHAVAVVLAMMVGNAAAMAQDSSAPPLIGPPAPQTPAPKPKPTPTPPENSQPDDILVTGLQVPGEPELDAEIGVGSMAGERTVANRQFLDRSFIFARCAANADRALLRQIVDGPPNRSDSAYALGLLVSQKSACHLFYTKDAFPEPEVIGRHRQGLFDRGAIIDQVIRTHAPDLRLTKRDTNDPAVKARFNAREVPRNEWRVPADYRYFEVALCMVRLQPEIAVRFVRSEFGGRNEGSAGKVLIDRARACIGNARKVTVDPSEFRVYVTDAVYRWAVAARGVESLIPAA